MPTWVPCASNLSGQIFIIPPSAGLFLLVSASPATIGAPGSISPVPSPRLYVPGFISTGRAYNDYQKLPSSIGSRHISGAPGSIAPGPIAQKTLPLLLVAGFESAWVQRRSEDNTAVRTIPQ
jgi:hypothetical protein